MEHGRSNGDASGFQGGKEIGEGDFLIGAPVQGGLPCGLISDLDSGESFKRGRIIVDIGKGDGVKEPEGIDGPLAQIGPGDGKGPGYQYVRGDIRAAFFPGHLNGEGAGEGCLLAGGNGQGGDGETPFPEGKEGVNEGFFAFDGSTDDLKAGARGLAKNLEIPDGRGVHRAVMGMEGDQKLDGGAEGGLGGIHLGLHRKPFGAKHGRKQQKGGCKQQDADRKSPAKGMSRIYIQRVTMHVRLRENGPFPYHGCRLLPILFHRSGSVGRDHRPPRLILQPVQHPFRLTPGLFVGCAALGFLVL